ncbi:hypothetical protein GCM10029964_030670 [Kibdelosporangium lantanae]
MTRFRSFSFVATLALTAAGMVAAGGSASAAANLLANPGFETGSTSGWDCAAATATRSPVHSGTYAVSFNGEGVGFGRCIQTIPVKENTRYTASAWVGSGARLAIDLCCSESITTDTGYTQLTVPFTTRVGQTTAEVFVHGPRGATAYADDVVLALGWPAGWPGGSTP